MMVSFPVSSPVISQSIHTSGCVERVSGIASCSVFLGTQRSERLLEPSRGRDNAGFETPTSTVFFAAQYEAVTVLARHSLVFAITCRTCDTEGLDSIEEDVIMSKLMSAKCIMGALTTCSLYRTSISSCLVLGPSPRGAYDINTHATSKHQSPSPTLWTRAQ